MTKRELLDAGTRLIGLWQVTSGAEELVTYGNIAAKYFSPVATSANGYLTHAIAHLFVGLVLFLFAANVVNAVCKPTPVAVAEGAA